MFPHEEFLLKALQESSISKIVADLGSLYLKETSDTEKYTMIDFNKALKISEILDKAAAEIADLGPKIRFKHPMDIKND